MSKLNRKFLTIIAIILVVIPIATSVFPNLATSDDQVYTGDSKDDPKDESSDYSEQ